MTETGDKTGEGELHRQLVACYYGINEDEKAIDRLKEGLGVAKETGDKREGVAYENLMICYHSLGQFYMFKRDWSRQKRLETRLAKKRLTKTLAFAIKVLASTRKRFHMENRVCRSQQRLEIRAEKEQLT